MQDADGDEAVLTRTERRRGLLPLSITMRRGGIAVACALAAIGLVFAWQAAQLDLGGFGLPGPGFFPLLIEPLGAYATLGLFGAVLLMLIARVSVVIAGIAAAIAMVACWYFFQVLLGLQLPDGPW